MLNDLPSDIEIIDNLDISDLDPMLKDYVFGSFFLAKLIDKSMKENKALLAENAELKLQIKELSEIKKRFDTVRDVLSGVPEGGPSTEFLDGLAGSMPDIESIGFVGRNKENLKELLDESNAHTINFNEGPMPVSDTVTASEEHDTLTDGLDISLDGLGEVSEVDAEMAESVEDVSETESVSESILDLTSEAEVAAVEEAPEPEAEAVLEVSPEPEPEPAPAPAVEIPDDPNASLSPEQIEAMFASAEAAPEPEPEPEPAPAPAVEIPDDPNASLSPEQIEAMFASAEAAAPEPEPEPEPAPAPAVEIPDDPNASLTPEQIAALFANA